MKSTFIYAVLIVLITISSCSKNEGEEYAEKKIENKNTTTSATNNFCDCETYAQNLLDNSEVCISGITNVTKESIYTYVCTVGNKSTSNKNTVNWEVLFGEIAIMNVHTDITKNYIISKCTVQFKNNFNQGSIKANVDIEGYSKPYYDKNEVQILIKVQD